MSDRENDMEEMIDEAEIERIWGERMEELNEEDRVSTTSRIHNNLLVTECDRHTWRVKQVGQR